jgi:hypothetical protein
MNEMQILMKHGRKLKMHGFLIELHTWIISFKKDIYLKTISFLFQEDL